MSSPASLNIKCGELRLAQKNGFHRCRNFANKDHFTYYYYFFFRKDYDTNKLWSGRLQLPDDTYLLIDETVMKAGRLVERGVKNMAALHALSLRQQLSPDFNTNIPLLILSKGKSMIPVSAIYYLLKWCYKLYKAWQLFCFLLLLLITTDPTRCVQHILFP